MAIPTFQKDDRVAFRESPEVEGKIVELWKGGFYKVAWDSGVTYRGKHVCSDRSGRPSHCSGDGKGGRRSRPCTRSTVSGTYGS